VSRNLAEDSYSMKTALGALALVALAGSSHAFAPPPPGRQPDSGPGLSPAEPVEIDGRLVFPDGAPVPRSLTEAERRYLERHPLQAPEGLRGPGGPTPPTGPVWCVPEYAPMDGLCLSWEGGSALTAIVAQIAAKITNQGGGRAYIAIDSNSLIPSATTTLNTYGTNMSNVTWVVRPMDTIWIRDYGPRYILEGNCRAIVDHIYNRPRPNDNTHPIAFGNLKKHAVYALSLIHGGGNYHLSGLGDSYATQLIVNENPSLSQLQIHDLWQSYQNVDTTIVQPFPTSVDATQHIDMWMQIIGDREVVISDWPMNVGSIQDTICDNTAAAMAADGYTVHRVVARSVNGTHYTYTNVVMFNDILLIPTYTNTSVAPHNAEALALWQTACPDKQIFQINCQAIVTLAGVMHCIVMHVPVAPGGDIPTAYLKSLRGGESLTPGAVTPVKWLADDNVGVSGVDVLLSYDAGATFPVTLASNIPHTGTYNWTVPDRFSRNVRVKVVARDLAGNSGFDASPASFTINGTCQGDWNGDGLVTTSDVSGFLTQWFSDLSGGTTLADFDGNGATNTSDVTGFLSAWFANIAAGGC